MKIFFVIMFAVFLASCDEKKTEKAKAVSPSNVASLKDSVLGIWTSSNTENAVFDIRKDSIYYVDQFASYKYRLYGNELIIDYADFTDTSIIRFKNDTLYLKNKDGETAAFWRFKQ